MEFHLKRNRRIKHILSLPFIYSMIIPAIILDVFITLYHSVSFRLYNLPLIKRSSYIRIDRQKLQYLNAIERIHCMYCGYVNGLFHYATVIAAETEKYWCGIQHKKGNGFIPPAHHKDFLPYGDKKAFEKKYLENDPYIKNK